MKHLLAIFVLICLSSSAFAQPYQSIFANGDSSTEWVFTYGVLPSPVIDTAYIEKDTVVNGITYKKVLTTEYWFPGGLLREDVNLGYVWYKDIYHSQYPSDTVERLVFRFDLNVGDTFDISNSYLEKGTYPDSLNIVDSIRYINGLKHIYFKATYQPIQGGYNEPFTIIEGVGSNMGVLWKHLFGGTFMADQYLLCSYKSGNKTGFTNKYYNGACTINTGSVNGTNKIRSSYITLYPSPAKGQIHIKNLSETKINRVQLISQTGQLVKEITSLEITSVEIEEIPAGYYYLKLYTSNGYITVKPMVIM